MSLVDELNPACEEDAAQLRLKRAIQIDTLRTAAQMILEISPEAARVLRDASRALLQEHIKEIQKAAQRG